MAEEELSKDMPRNQGQIRDYFSEFLNRKKK